MMPQHLHLRYHQNAANIGTHRLDDGSNHNERNIYVSITITVSVLLVAKSFDTDKVNLPFRNNVIY